MLYDAIRETRNATEPEGVRKIFEGILKEGRTLVLTDLSVDTSALEHGTLFVNPNTFKLSVLKPNGISSFLPDDIFEPLTLTDSVVKLNSINGTRIREQSITREKINPFTLTSNEIAPEGILSESIHNKAILSKHFDKGAVDENAIGPGAVTENKIGLIAIKERHLDKEIVTTTKIAKGAVNAEQLHELSVSNLHIQSDAIRNQHILKEEIKSRHIAPNNILSTHILEKQINEKHYAFNSIYNKHLSEKCIATSNLENLSITNDKIANSTITLAKLDKPLSNYITSCVQIVDRIAYVPNLQVQDNIRAFTMTVTQMTMTSGFMANGSCSIDRDLSVGGNLSVKGRNYNAIYNDLAEAYVPGEVLEVGDIVEIRSDGKVYKSSFESSKVVGVISKDYATCYGATEEELLTKKKVAVGLIGKIPVKVFGRVNVGQYIVPGDDGIGYPVLSGRTQTVIGKAIASKISESTEKVMCLVFPS